VLKRTIETEIDLADLVEAGLSAAALDHLMHELVGAVGSQTAVFEAVGSPRTLQRKRAEQTTLSHDESDRLARLARLLARAEEALGAPDKARRWMAKPNRALEGRTPLSLAHSDAGALAVENVLGRIEHGVYS
jgi:putative toxin-antitoxin system antitoxin component (TIGR02293 family)